MSSLLKPKVKAPPPPPAPAPSPVADRAEQSNAARSSVLDKRKQQFQQEDTFLTRGNKLGFAAGARKSLLGL